MKKRMLMFSVFALIFFSSFIIALEACEDGDIPCKTNNAYSCLNDKIDAKGCSALSSSEKVFSALATGDCRTDLTSDSKFKTDVKYTAQAVLALGGNTEGEDWLIAQEGTPTNMDWFLQVESTEATDCKVSYNNKNYDFSLDEDKRISSNAGTCLSLATGNYWFEINSACYGDIFEVTCNQPFLTSLIYQKENSDTIFVSENTHNADVDGTTSEQVNSSCFKKGSSCDYEGSLWAGVVLDSLGYDVSPYLPYLITLEEEDANQKLLPKAFLYRLTGDFMTELLDLQKNSKWWAESNDKFYDTAMALFALYGDEPPQKQDAITWLFDESQDTDGCWNNGNLRNTAALLYAIEPRASVAGGSGVDCESSGNFCLSSISCNEAGGEQINGQDCSGALVCCSEDKVVESCEAQSGEVCNSNQNCVRGTKPEASGLGVGQVCCVGGSCEVPSDELSACESSGGECRVSGCFDDEQKSYESCDYSIDTCCIPKPGGGFSIFWIVFLLILITLVVVGILYKDKLRRVWFNFKNRFLPKKGGVKPRGPGGRRPPFSPSPAFRRRPLPRRVIPAPIKAPSSRAPVGVRPGLRPRPPIRPRKELDSVLKKLKDMGK